MRNQVDNITDQVILTFFPELRCPLSNRLMREPVVHTDGRSYERTSIEAQNGQVVGRRRVQINQLIQNRSLRRFVEEMRRVIGRYIDTNRNLENLNFAPDNFAELGLECPILLELMPQAEITNDGRSYDNDSIRQVIRASGQDPLTRQNLRENQLRHNLTLRNLITGNKNLNTLIREINGINIEIDDVNVRDIERNEIDMEGIDFRNGQIRGIESKLKLFQRLLVSVRQILQAGPPPQQQQPQPQQRRQPQPQQDNELRQLIAQNYMRDANGQEQNYQNLQNQFQQGIQPRINQISHRLTRILAAMVRVSAHNEEQFRNDLQYCQTMIKHLTSFRDQCGWIKGHGRNQAERNFANLGFNTMENEIKYLNKRIEWVGNNDQGQGNANENPFQLEANYRQRQQQRIRPRGI